MIRIFDNLYMIDLTPPQYKISFIFSYIIKTKDYLVCIDQGPKSMSEKLLSIIEEEKGDRKVILIPTHIHLDHAGGVGSILSEIDNAVAYVHPRGARHLVNPTKLWNAAKEAVSEIADVWGKPTPAPKDKVYSSVDGQELHFNNYKFKIIFTEGHSSHHQSIYQVNYGVMFTGDSAGIYIPSLDYILLSIPERLDIYYKSLHKMLKYDIKYLMFAHCGYTKDGVEKLKNIFGS